MVAGSAPSRARLVERSSSARVRPRNAKFERCRRSSSFHESAKSCSWSSPQSMGAAFRRRPGATLEPWRRHPFCRAVSSFRSSPDRRAFLSGRYAKVYDEIVQVKEACGDAHLKVILEVAELGPYDNVRRASLLAMAAGADFIKTSTGKLPGAATLPVTLCMLEAIRDVYEETGRMVGMKPAGGIRQAKQAVQYLVQLHETLGVDWLTPDLYRLGASSLLNDVLMQLRKEKTGAYQSPDYFTVD